MYHSNSKLKSLSAVILRSLNNVGKITVYAEVIYLMLPYTL